MDIKKMLDYYGAASVEEFGKALGFYAPADALRALVDCYEEDILWDEPIAE